MKNNEKSVLRRVAAVTMIVMMTMTLGIAVYADADAPVIVDESEIAAFGPIDESTIVGIGAEPIDEGAVVAIGAEPADESTLAAIGAEAEENTVAIDAENQSSSTSSRQKDSVPKTGEADYTVFVLPVLLFGIAGMIFFGRKRCLYESA